MPKLSDAKDPPPVKGKLSFLQPETGNFDGATQQKTSSTLPAPPINGNEWVQLATQLLTGRNHQLEKRTIEVCQSAALALLDEAERKEEEEARAARGGDNSVTSTHRRLDTQQDEDDDDFSPRELQDGEEGRPLASARSVAAVTSTERVEAAYVLVAGCVAALERNTAGSVAKAISLAQQSCLAWNSPMCSLALAWAHSRACGKLPERNAQDASLSSATAAAASCAAAILRLSQLNKDDEVQLVRVAWLLAALGEVESAQLCVNRLLQTNPSHLMGLLLLAQLHTVEGDSGSAMAACVRLVQEYPSDIGGALMLTALKQFIGPTAVGGDAAPDETEDTLDEELGVALARVREASAASSSGKGQGRKRSLKSFCIHPAPGEVQLEAGTAAVPDNNKNDSNSSGAASAAVLTPQEASRRVAGYWALLAYLCVRVGAFPMAEMAIEAGLDFVAAAKPVLYRKAFADLLSSRARLALMRLWAKVSAVPGHQQQLGAGRDVNLLGRLQPARVRGGGAAARTAEGSLYSLKAEVRGAALLPGDPAFLHGASEPLADASRLLSARDLGPILTYLVKATEAYPDHAEARYLMGIVHFLEASQPDLPRRAVEQKRASAAAYFTETMRIAPMYVEPQLGLACVREVQGATDAALDIYASATELSFREPLIPFDRFMFLFE